MSGSLALLMFVVLAFKTITGVGSAQIANAKVIRGNIRRDGKTPVAIGRLMHCCLMMIWLLEMYYYFKIVFLCAIHFRVHTAAFVTAAGLHLAIEHKISLNYTLTLMAAWGHVSLHASSVSRNHVTPLGALLFTDMRFLSRHWNVIIFSLRIYEAVHRLTLHIVNTIHCKHVRVVFGLKL